MVIFVYSQNCTTITKVNFRTFHDQTLTISPHEITSRQPLVYSLSVLVHLDCLTKLPQTEYFRNNRDFFPHTVLEAGNSRTRHWQIGCLVRTGFLAHRWCLLAVSLWGRRGKGSVTQFCPTLCEPMDCRTPGLPVPHHLPEFAQVHVHWIGDAIQLSHSVLPPSPSALTLSQHQGLFQWVGSSHQVAKVLELQHQSFQWIFRVDIL